MEPIRTIAREQGLQFPAGWSFVPIKPGSFVMGSPQEEIYRISNEGPQRHVTLTRSFWMAAYEVTQQQYEELMGRNPSAFKSPHYPVEMVSWNDVHDFIKKLNEREHEANRLPKSWEYRLPTEAEWEYACRAGTKTAYCFGNDSAFLEEYAWYDANSGKKIHDVGQKRPNPWGLYDMRGNVWEWCTDWKGDYSKEPATDPSGALFGMNRVFRGGGGSSGARLCRSAFRGGNVPDFCYNGLGFRVLASPASKQAEAIRYEKGNNRNGYGNSRSHHHESMPVVSDLRLRKTSASRELERQQQ